MTYATAMDALGDATRRQILERLRGGPRAVGELAAELPVSRPAVSQHLRVLKEAGLVTERRDGTRRLYRVDPKASPTCAHYLESFWEQALAGFEAAAERRREEDVTTTRRPQAVRKTLVVESAPERAFEVFTRGIGTWWPFDTHSIGGEQDHRGRLREHVGGRIFERHDDGGEGEWGRVLAWEPPPRFAELVARARPLRRRHGARGALRRRGRRHPGRPRAPRLGDPRRTGRGGPVHYDGGWGDVLSHYTRHLGG